MKTFNCIFVIAILVVWSLPANAITTFVSPSGNDSNDCRDAATPCLTIQAAVNKTGDSTRASSGIYIADGTYTAGADVSHFKHINFLGNCKNPGAVLITKTGGYVFSAQDHATMTFNCLRIDATNGIAIYARQFSIADYTNVIFGPAESHVLAGELSKINCANATIAGSATYHVRAEGGSSISIACPMKINAGVSMLAFVKAGHYSIVIISGANITGNLKSGAQYFNNGARIIYGATPKLGTASGNVCKNGCFIE
jgi:hypothetical protein